MGKAQSSFLTDEPFAALFCLLAIGIVLAPTAVHAGTKSFYMVMLPVLPHYFAHLGANNLWVRRWEWKKYRKN